MVHDAAAATGSRKDSHIRICLEDQVEYYAPESSGFAAYRFDHDALPEVDKDAINLSVTFLGKRLAAPLVIGAMTGGTERAAGINQRLARAAERCQVGFALGSQRILLEKPELKGTYAAREHAPGLPLLLGNVGAVQLNYGMTGKDVRRLAEMAGVDAFNFHLNPLQEAIQPEGDVNFSGLLAKLERAIPEIGVPVLLKEVGSGISEATARKVKHLPLSGIETAGSGGTSWSKIEALRSSGGVKRAAGELFARWGVPTPESIVNCRTHLPHLPVVASGGIRNGIEVAKALALGAEVAAFALPLLKAAEKSEDAVVEALEGVIEELRIACFVTGSRDIQSLREKPLRRAMDLTAQSWAAGRG